MNIKFKNNILRILKIILISVAVITPFVVTRDLFFPFITGKNFFFRIAVEVAFGFWLFLVLLNKDYRPKKSPVLFSMIALVALMFLADILGADPNRSLWSNFERMEGFVGLLHLFVYFIVLSSVFKTWTDWRTFLKWSVVGSFVMVLFGLTQLSCSGVNSGEVVNISNQTINFCKKFVINQGGVRVDGSLGNAIYLAVYMLFNLFFALFLYFKESKKWWKIFYVIFGIGALFLIYYTATRGVMLGLFGGLFLLTLLLAVNKSVNSKIKRNAFFVLIGLALLGVIFVSFRNSDFIRKFPPLSRLADISLQSSDASARFMVWGSAIEGFKEKPILGWGQENFGLVFDKYYNPEMYDREQWFDRAHNALLDWLLSGGILALLLYLALIYFTIYSIWQKRGEQESHNLSGVDKAVLTSMLAAYIFQSLFVFDNVVGSILLFSLFAMVHSLSVVSKENYLLPEINFEINNGNKWIVVIGIGVVIVGASFFFNYKGLMTSRVLIKALVPNEKGIQGNFEDFQKAINYKSFGNQEVREHLMQSAISLANNQNIPVDIRNQFVNFSVEEMRKQIEEKPLTVRPRYFLGSMLSMFGQYDLAINELEKALELAPNKTGVLIELAVAYIKKGDNDKSFEYATQAYDGAPDLLSLKRIYVSLAIYTDNFGKVTEVWNSMSDFERAEDRILQAFASTKQFAKIIEVLSPVFEKDKNNKTTGVSLAVAYMEAGYKNKAVQILREMIEIDSTFKTEGEKYIQEMLNN